MTERAIDFEAEYNNRARVPDHGVFIDGWHNDAAAYRATAACELDLSYGPGSATASISSIRIKATGRWCCSSMAATGRLSTSPRQATSRGVPICAVSRSRCRAIRWRPKRTSAEIVGRIEQAADFVARRMQRPLIVAGHSAGGHLAACLMARSGGAVRPIRAGMPISGLFDLSPLVSTSINKALGLTTEEAARLSPGGRRRQGAAGRCRGRRRKCRISPADAPDRRELERAGRPRRNRPGRPSFLRHGGARRSG